MLLGLRKKNVIVPVVPEHVLFKIKMHKAESLQLNQTQFPSLGIFVNKKVGNQKN